MCVLDVIMPKLHCEPLDHFVHSVMMALDHDACTTPGALHEATQDPRAEVDGTISHTRLDASVMAGNLDVKGILAIFARKHFHPFSKTEPDEVADMLELASWCRWYCCCC